MSNENNAGVDLAQLDKLELRAKEEKGEGYKLMAVKHDVILALIDLARRASATPSSKDAGGEPMYQISIDCTNVLWKDVDKEDYDEHPSDWKREKRIVYAAPAHAAAAPSWEQGRDAQRYRKLAARFKYDHIGQGRNGYHYDADPIPGDGLEFDAAVDALPAVEPDTTDMAGAAGAGSEQFDWMKAERIRDEDHVDEALRNFREDPTGDNATGVIQAALTVWTADVRALAKQSAAPAAPHAQAAPVHQMRSLTEPGGWLDTDADGPTSIKRMPHWASVYEFRTLSAAPVPQEAEQAGDIELIRIPAHDADSYCRILSIIGMEEEGDPVAEVQRLFDAAQEAEQATTAAVTDERAAFKAHFIAEGWGEHHFERYNVYDPDDTRNYHSRHITDMWDGWKARAALAQPAAPAVTDGSDPSKEWSMRMLAKEQDFDGNIEAGCPPAAPAVTDAAANAGGLRNPEMSDAECREKLSDYLMELLDAKDAMLARGMARDGFAEMLAQFVAAFDAGRAPATSAGEVKDAERYRVLRDNALMGYPSAEGSSNKDAYLVVTGYGWDDNQKIVDEAVDTAISNYALRTKSKE